MKTKYRISKCYLIQILDEAGNEITSVYSFENRTDALQTARDLKAEIDAEIAKTENEIL